MITKDLLDKIETEKRIIYNYTSCLADYHNMYFKKEYPLKVIEHMKELSEGLDKAYLELELLETELNACLSYKYT